ncbi:MAG TPA: SDR family NAD(P)-dependent oxidoreductase [Acidimicrobiia bacterium]|nr:SDR family NAD(P)-dependent oxidoreductase [Acidimicrobiia bacterium]
MDLGLDGKVALVTGGTRGIGRAAVLALAREGVRVAFCARDAEAVKLVEKEVAAEGGTGLGVAIDLADRAAADELVARTVDTFGDLDILVAAAGVHKIKEFADLTDEEWDETFEVNFFAPMRVCRAAIPHMQRKQAGHIVIVSAGSIHKPSIGPDVHPHYTAAKAAVANLGKFLSKQYGPDNIVVNTVLPGYSIRDEVQELWANEAEAAGLSAEEHFVRMATDIGYLPAMRRPGTPEEFANVITFIVSDANSFMSGVELAIDGAGLDG